MTDNQIDTQNSENTEKLNYKTLEQAFSLGNGQNTALNWLMETKQTVSVFLVSGIKLEGVISGHDQYSMALTDASGNQQLIYKAKISTITIAGSAEKPAHRNNFRQNNHKTQRNYQNQN